MPKKPSVSECCPLFTEALHSGGSMVEGLYIPMKRGGRKGSCYAFQIKAKGRGGKRTVGRNLVIEHCPFCGTSPPRPGPLPPLPVNQPLARTPSRRNELGTPESQEPMSQGEK